MKNILLIFILGFILIQSKGVLRLKNGTFKISQFTDLHFGEGENTKWGPEQDMKSKKAMYQLLEYENANLVIFTGDQLTGNNIKENATLYWDSMLEPLINRGQQWVAVMGNHDDLEWQDGLGSIIKRQQLYEHDMQYEQSLTKIQYWSNQCGANSYYELVFDEQEEEKVVMVLWMLDTGGGTIQENVCQDTIEWIKQQYSLLTQYYGNHFIQMAFMHIPLQQYVNAYHSNKCVGMNENGGVTPTENDTGLYSLFSQIGLTWVVAGHDHGNDWCCKSDNNINLCFGRHTGYGGYGNWERGTRIYLYHQSNFTVTSYVRLENGQIIHQYS